MVSTEGNDNRRDPRIDASNAITFSQLNKEETYVGIAQDFSRSGMFFRSSRELKPGDLHRHPATELSFDRSFMGRRRMRKRGRLPLRYNRCAGP